MKAIRIHEEGGPEVLRYEDVHDPVPADGEVLVELRAASLNHLDLWLRKGTPSVPKPRILGAAILATGSLRNSVVVWHHNDATAFPREFVLMYGGFFTLLLALLYAPVYQTLLDTGRKLVDGACPAVEPRSSAWTDVYEKRKKLEELLQLEVTTSSSFRAGIAIMAPLASSVVGLLLGKA